MTIDTYRTLFKDLKHNEKEKPFFKGSKEEELLLDALDSLWSELTDQEKDQLAEEFKE